MVRKGFLLKLSLNLVETIQGEELSASLFITKTVFQSIGTKNTQKNDRCVDYMEHIGRQSCVCWFETNRPDFTTCVGEIGNHAGLSSRYYEFKSRTQGFYGSVAERKGPCLQNSGM